MTAIKAKAATVAHYGFRKLMLRVSPVVFERRLPAALFFRPTAGSSWLGGVDFGLFLPLPPLHNAAFRRYG
ncbi:hypothetical protein [Jeongeupia naejangsanensis]|uniref:Uncharacterized protein n=1 Tax=Jeongeupia naejangsanensis TaxID=613195 RepID=A0ABS2BGC9_9NEIS|nr:hypothetical protein [Jeongeupia naejangsanensis]MBM3114672.1 hypothetical protein [Jeongeupia naejangsanensis]